MGFHFEEDAMIDNTEMNICNKHRFTAQDCMTTLDYFAAKAMQGLLISEYTSERGLHEGWMRSMAHEAYLIAEAMMRTSGVRIKQYRQQSDALFSAGARLALELECLLLSCEDTAAVSKWWDSAHEALQQWRDLIGGLEESFKPLDAPFAPDWAGYRQGRKDGYADAIEEAAARLESVGCGHCAENVKSLLQRKVE